MDGVLVVYKPSGPTSHDLVERVRRRFAIRRVGHTGTLDPLAEGVLVLVLGRATRLAEYVVGHDKKYRAGLLLGLSTDTLDIQGTIMAEASAVDVTSAKLLAALENFRVSISQVPPMHSAVKVDGERLYRLARSGKTIERPTRQTYVTKLDLEYFQPGERARASLDCTVAAGCYIRSLCADIGAHLGVGGCMEWLIRTASGPFTSELAVDMEVLEKMSSAEVQERILPPAVLVEGVPRVDIDSSATALFCNGGAVDSEMSEAGIVRVHGIRGELLGIGKIEDGSKRVRPLKVICDA